MARDHNTPTDSFSRMSYHRIRRRIKWMDVLGLRNTCDQAEKWRIPGLATILVLGVVFAVYFADSITFLQQSEISGRYGSFRGSSRHLLQDNNTAADHGPAWESCDFEKANSKWSWLVNHIFFILVIFIGIAIVCDDFFVPSLEIISEKLSLSEDVAGATFMAAGSSAPELFSSIAGVAVESDVGVGTIVGSAVFNLLIIIALTAALAGQVLKLDWRPLARDSFFYAMSLGCFIGFSWDGEFTHYESAILLILYFLYILLMVFNPRLMDWMGTWKSSWCPQYAKEEDISKVEPTALEDGKDKSDQQCHDSSIMHAGDRKIYQKLGPLSLTGGHARRVTIVHMIAKNAQHDVDHHASNRQFVHQHRGSVAGVLLNRTDTHRAEGAIIEEGSRNRLKEEDEVDDNTMDICPCLPCCPAIRTWPPNSESAHKEGGCMNWMKLIFKWILFIPAFPFVVLYSWTIPNCGKAHLKKWYIVSFLMSVFWIALLSFGLVTLVGRSGCILNIDSYIMGLVVVAIGTSIPDALSSVLVARDGYGDMAVSNAIGSNVFDINLGLGLPFLIRIAIDRGRPISLLDSQEAVDHATGHMLIIQHAKFGFILVLILVFALIVFIISKFKLNKSIGISFVVMYVIFILYAMIQELVCIRSLEMYC